LKADVKFDFQRGYLAWINDDGTEMWSHSASSSSSASASSSSAAATAAASDSSTSSPPVPTVGATEATAQSSLQPKEAAMSTNSSPPLPLLSTEPRREVTTEGSLGSEGVTVPKTGLEGDASAGAVTSSITALHSSLSDSTHAMAVDEAALMPDIEMPSTEPGVELPQSDFGKTMTI
jgi:hypothetical protein